MARAGATNGAGWSDQSGARCSWTIGGHNVMPVELLAAGFLLAHAAIHVGFIAPPPPATADGTPEALGGRNRNERIWP